MAASDAARQGPHARRREAELAARWAAGEWRGRELRTEGGEGYTLLYQGRRGGGAGPDFRDAVLARPDGSRIRGDVELHLRARDWRAHGHGADPRYNAVVLHAVLATGEAATPLASGALVPVVVLRPNEAPPDPSLLWRWPCDGLPERLGPASTHALFVAAGEARFALRAAALARELAAPEPPCAGARAARWTPPDRALFVALAEALGYGRDRAALREAGTRLAAGDAPDALLAEAGRMPRVERLRLGGLLALFAVWSAIGPWPALRPALEAGPPRAAARALVARLRVTGGRVSPGRAAILVANVVLPFAAAYAARHGEAALGERARAVWAALPGPPSNAITREMARQLGLRRLPSGAAAQQGLHHLWAAWCRDKRCDRCPCAAGEHAAVRTARTEGS